ncbi:hypothetical protein KQI65_07150 [bacterium]|nr:hypothetical protein [bacterium]
MRRFLIAAFICMVFSPATGVAQENGDDPVRIERLDARHWRITVRNAEPSVLHDRSGGDQPSRVRIPGYLDEYRDGYPVLPLRSVQFALPPEARIAVQVSGAVEERFSFGLRTFGDLSPQVPPASWTQAGEPQSREGLAIGSVLLRPVRYDPATEQVIWLRSMTVDVRIAGGNAGVPLTHADVYPGVVNLADAMQWRKPQPLARRAAPAVRAGEQLLKIRTAVEGMHRISFADFAAAGIDASTLDARTLRLTLMEQELPIELQDGGDGRLGPGEGFLFFAPRNHGADGEYLDEWMTDNVFILHWGGAQGLRYTTEDVAPVSHPGAQTVTSLPLKLHLEEDHEYHRGDFEYGDMMYSRKVFGEGWVWGYLLKQDSIVTDFDLNTPASEQATLRVRAKGSSRDSSLMRVILNGSVLGEYVIPPTDMMTLDFPVPAGLLQPTANHLTFYGAAKVQCPPENPTCSIERFYLDWAELRYASSLQDGSALRIDPAARYSTSSVPAEALVDIPVSAGGLEGFNLNAGTRLTGMDITAGRARLALDSSGSYYIYDPTTAVHTPASVQAVTIEGYAENGFQADYLVVTHRDFMPQAQRLATYREQSDGYSTVVADVEDIYNEFNYGHKDPEAIRRFTEHAWREWQSPAPRFLLLMGDASWDPRQVAASSSRVDYVPSYGNPASDNYYVSFAEDPGDPYPYLAVGRIPAESPEQADAVIDKIIAYEGAPPQPWDNRFLFSVGGQNAFEQITLRDFAETLIDYRIDPACLEPRLIVKKTLDLVSYDDLDTLIHEINRGVGFFMFAGHGGTRVIDVGIERPDIFDNKDKYMFFATMSCNTAHFAEPFETGLNERFVLSPENGAVVAYGTSGLGEIGVDFYVSDGLLKALTDSLVRNYGEMSVIGKRNAMRVYSGLPPSVVHAVNQLCILGDPATKVPLAKTPELAVRASEIRTDPEIITEQSNTIIYTRIRNYGMCMPDSADVRLTISHGGEGVFTELRRIAPWSYDTLELAWEYDFAGIWGTVEVTVEVDAGFEIVERDESNNIATAEFSVLPRGITLIFPLERAVLQNDGQDREFLVANPTFLPDEALNPVVQMEYSTDPNFAGGVQQLSSEAGPVFTAFEIPTPAQDGVYFWRARISTDQGPESWSRPRSFTVTSQQVSGDLWQQSADAQFPSSETDALTLDRNGGVKLGERRLPLEVVSGGFNGPIKHVIISAGEKMFYPANRGASRGFNVAVVEPVFGRITDSLTFDTYSGRDEAARMTNFLQSVPDDHYVIVGVEDDANGFPPSSIDGTNITPELRSELTRFGATLIDSVGYRDSYVLIGSRDHAASAVDEHFVLGTAVARDTLTVLATQGSFTTPVMGPINSLESLRWNGTPGAAGAGVDMAVLAMTASGDSVIASYENVAPGELITVRASLPSAFLRLRVTLRDPDALGSPVLREFRAAYTSHFPETGITSQVVHTEADSVSEGETMVVTAAVYNAGREAAQGWDMRLVVPGSEIAVSKPLPTLQADRNAPAEMEFELPTAGIAGQQRYELHIVPSASSAEYHLANNVFSDRFRVGRDGMPPDLDVRFDGMEIVDNDFVSPTPLIEVRLRDASPLPVTDTSAVEMFLDGHRVWLASDPDVVLSTGAGDEKVHVAFSPTLQDGLHFLAVSGEDASGNAADTIPYQVRFNVSSEEMVDQVLPYPSPTTGPMDFTFRVRGTAPPEEARVKIYTVAGRLIRVIDADPSALRIGFNRIPWEGRDEDGDDLANGVYFFKLVVRHQDASQAEITGRFAVLR